MARPRKSPEKHQVAPEAALAGILALLVNEREDRTKENKEAPKTEIILANAGLSLEDIAAVTGKNYNTVRMAITRAKGR